jgi:ABC-2 type transport system permease protein
MKSYAQLLTTGLKLFLREPITAFFTLGFPVMLVLIFGAIYGNEPTPLFGGYGSMDVSMPGYTALILGAVGFMTVAINTSSYREARILRRFRATPLRPTIYILADVTTNLLMTLLGMIGVVLVGWLLYRVRFEGQAVSVVAAVILSALAMFSFGYVIASLAPNARAAQVVSMVIFYPMMFLSGAGMPLEILPATIRRISDFLPLTYAARLLRGLWFGDAWDAHLLEVAVLGGILVVCTALAGRFFRWE